MYLAFDLGASSGRAIVGKAVSGGFELTEIHRFPTHLIEENGHLYWDLARIEAEINTGLERAVQQFPDIQSLSVTTWGVDYVPLDQTMQPLRNAFCYRDPRKEGVMDHVHTLVSREEIYASTGIQFMDINSLYQLYADVQQEPEVVEAAHMYLMVSDYFNFRLGGKPVIEVSQASTTQFMDAKTQRWSESLFTKLGLPLQKWPEIVPSGTVIGHHPKYPNIKVIAGLSHDTGAAVAGVPADLSTNWCYISSGTWSLLGALINEPDLSEDACKASFTNEAGHDGKIRFLKNITGLWVLQECEREWKEQGIWPGYDALIAEARIAGNPSSRINLNDPRFGLRGSMLQKIADYCLEAAQPVPATPAENAALILRSLATHYHETLMVLENLRNTRYEVIHIVGGGSQNSWLCELTGEITGRRIVAGPVEATALGNLKIQQIAVSAY